MTLAIDAEMLVQGSPYPGLPSFKADESHLFFGREQQTVQLLERLERRRFLAIVGPSGAGKSSLVKAGLIASLEAGFMSRAGARWRVVDMRPGERPMTKLAYELIKPSALGPECGGEPFASEILLAMLRRGPLGLVEALHANPLPPRTNLLLIVDQFEEVFRYRDGVALTDPARAAAPHADEANDFVALLLRTVEVDVPVYVVLTMRSDFIGNCARFPGLPEALNEGQFLTPRLTREQHRQAITLPAEVCGATLDAGLVNRLLNDMGPDPDQLPPLQHALMRMWISARDRATNRNDDSIRLTFEDYERVGGLAGAMSHHATEIYDSLSDDQKQAAEKLFRALATITSDNKKVRRPTKVKDIQARVGPGTDVIPIIDRFRAKGVSFISAWNLSADEPLTPDTIVDLTHESLITRWDNFKRWSDDEGAATRTLMRLKDEAEAWAANRASQPLIYSPDKLNEIARIFASFNLRPSDEQAQFLLLSRQHHEQERQKTEKERRKKRWIWGAIVSLVMVSILLTAGLSISNQHSQELKKSNEATQRNMQQAVAERHRAERATRRATAALLASKAATELTDRPQRGLLLALEAVKTVDAKDDLEPTAVTALYQAVSQVNGHVLSESLRDTAVVEWAATPDGRWVLTLTHDNRLTKWRYDASPAEAAGPLVAVAVFPADAERTMLSGVSPDGRWALVTSVNGTRSEAFDGASIESNFPQRWALWDLSQPDPGIHATALGFSDESIGTTMFSPDGRWLLVTGSQKRASFWELGEKPAEHVLASGRATSQRAPTDVRWATARFSPTGRWLTASGGADERRRFVWRVETDGRLTPTSLGSEFMDRLAFSPDDKTLALTNAEGTLTLAEWSEDKAQWAFRTLATAFVAPSSGLPAPTESAKIGAPPERRMIPAKPAPPTRANTFSDVAFAADGSAIAAYQKGVIHLWRRTPSGTWSAFAIRCDAILSEDCVVGFSGDANWLVVNTDVGGRYSQSIPDRDKRGAVLLQLRWDELEGLLTTPMNRTARRQAPDDGPARTPLQSRAATGADSSDARALTWQALDRRLLWSLSNIDAAVPPRFTADSRALTTARPDGALAVWPLRGEDNPWHDADAQPYLLRWHESRIKNLSLTPDGRWLFARSADGMASRHELRAGEPALSYQRPGVLTDALIQRPHRGPNDAINGQWLAEADEVRAGAWLYYLGEHGLSTDLLAGLQHFAETLAIDPAGRRLVLLDHPNLPPTDGTTSLARGLDVPLTYRLRIATLETGKVAFDPRPLEVDGLSAPGSQALQLTADARWLFVGQLLSPWSVQGTGIDTEASNTTRPAPMLNGTLWNLDAPGGPKRFPAGSTEGALLNPRLPEAYLSKGKSTDRLNLTGDEPKPLSSLPGKLIGLVPMDQEFKKLGVLFASFSPDGQLALTHDAESQRFTLLRLDRNPPEPALVARADGQNTLCFTRNGSRIIEVQSRETASMPTTEPAAGGESSSTTRPDVDAVIRVWSRDTESEWRSVEFRFSSTLENGLMPFAFSPDARWMVLGSPKSGSRLIDLNDATSTRTGVEISGEEGSPCSFSPKGGWLLLASHKGTLRLRRLGEHGISPRHDIALMESPEFARNFFESLRLIEFSDDERWLAVATDKTIRLWDLHALNDHPEDAEPVTLIGHESAVDRLSFAEGLPWLISSNSNELRVWRLGVPDIVALAEQATGRKLSAAERQQYKVPSN